MHDRQPAAADQGERELSVSVVFSRVVALIGGTALQLRRLTDGEPEPAWGRAPAIPAAKPQGSHPDAENADGRGWADGQMPMAAPGLKVNAFATGLEHPRWIEVLPNGDVLVAEAMSMTGRPVVASTTPWSAPCDVPTPWGSAPIASRCCATPMATGWPKSARCSWTG